MHPYLKARIEQVRAQEEAGELPTAEHLKKQWHCPYGDGFATSDPNHQLSHLAGHRNNS